MRAPGGTRTRSAILSPCARRHDGDRAQGPATAGIVSSPPWPGLRGDVALDACALSLARGSPILSSGPTGGLSGIRGRDQGGVGPHGRARSPDASRARELAAAPHGRGVDGQPARGGDDHGDSDDGPSRTRRSDALQLATPAGGLPRARAGAGGRSQRPATATSVGSWSNRQAPTASRPVDGRTVRAADSRRTPSICSVGVLRVTMSARSRQRRVTQPNPTCVWAGRDEVNSCELNGPA